MRHLSLLAIAIALWLGGLAPGHGQTGTLKVMSYNVRYGTAPDGENRWERRRDVLIEAVLAFDPDLLGAQEVLAFQRDFLAERLPELEAFGVGRDFGDERGEMTAVFFRRARFELVDGGHFWLSETPWIPGSKSWDSALTRMVTWLRLRDRAALELPEVMFFNTHFDHRGKEARVRSAALLRDRVGEMAEGRRAIVVGDFNAAEDSAPYRTLFDCEVGKPGLVDTYRAAHPERRDDEGTFSRFDVAPAMGGRIDWIAATTDWTVLDARILRHGRAGRAPSDHFPVAAELRWSPQARSRCHRER